MKKLIVDTSSIISFFEGKNLPILYKAFEDGAVFLPAIVISELLNENLFITYRKELKQILRSLPMCNSDFFHWANVGEISNRFAKIKITIRDAHIIQCALDADILLHTQNTNFKKLSNKFNLKIIKK